MATLKRMGANGQWEYIQLTGEDISSLVSDLNSTKTSLAEKANQTDLANKRDKSVLITLNDVAQDVKTAMTGGSVAVVGTDAVDTVNLKDGSATSLKRTALGGMALLVCNGLPNFDFTNKILRLPQSTRLVYKNNLYVITTTTTMDISIDLGASYTFGAIFFDTSNSTFVVKNSSVITSASESFILVATFYSDNKKVSMIGSYTVDGVIPYVDDKITALNNIQLISQLTWEQGTLRPTQSGVEGAATNRIRTKIFTVSGKSTINFNGNSQYKFYVFCYDLSTGAYVKSVGWLTNSAYTLDNTYQYRLLMAYVSDIDLTPLKTITDNLRVVDTRWNTTPNVNNYITQTNPYVIYDKSNKYNGKLFVGTTLSSLQAIIKDNNYFYVFSNTGVITKYDFYGTLIETKTVTGKFSHLINASIMSNGHFLVSSSEDDGTRPVYEYDYTTNTILNTYTVPSVTGLTSICSYPIDSDTILMAYVYDDLRENGKLFYYTYKISTNTQTYVSEHGIRYKYGQGGFIMGNLVYTMTNNGYVTATDDNILYVTDYTTGEVINKYTIKGIGECEGVALEYNNNQLVCYTMANWGKTMLMFYM